MRLGMCQLWNKRLCPIVSLPIQGNNVYSFFHPRLSFAATTRYIYPTASHTTIPVRSPTNSAPFPTAPHTLGLVLAAREPLHPLSCASITPKHPSPQTSTNTASTVKNEPLTPTENVEKSLEKQGSKHGKSTASAVQLTAYSRASPLPLRIHVRQHVAGPTGPGSRRRRDDGRRQALLLVEAGTTGWRSKQGPDQGQIAQDKVQEQIVQR
ncbi:hypothetical protein BKA80DRAFT_278152 [Phyllosticta citrichinensis]